MQTSSFSTYQTQVQSNQLHPPPLTFSLPSSQFNPIASAVSPPSTYYQYAAPDSQTQYYFSQYPPLQEQAAVNRSQSKPADAPSVSLLAVESTEQNDEAKPNTSSCSTQIEKEAATNSENRYIN